MVAKALTGRLGPATNTPARTRVIEAALDLFAEHGISGTSLQMIADAIGVTKAAVYHQYNTKEEIVRAVAEVVLAGLEAALTSAEAERSRSRARELLIARMVDLAVERRRMAGILQRDPVMLRFLDENERSRKVLERQAAIVTAAIAGTVIHPLGRDLDDQILRAELTKQLRKLFRA